MRNDPVVDEVRKYRNKFAAKHHYNFDEIFRSIKNLEEKSKQLKKNRTS